MWQLMDNKQCREKILKGGFHIWRGKNVWIFFTPPPSIYYFSAIFGIIAPTRPPCADVMYWSTQKGFRKGANVTSALRLRSPDMAAGLSVLRRRSKSRKNTRTKTWTVDSDFRHMPTKCLCAIDSYCVSYGEGLFTLNNVKWQPHERRWWPNFHTVPRPSKCSSPEMYKMTKQN